MAAIFGDHDSIIVGLNVAVCLAVLLNVYGELSTVFSFALNTSDKDHFLMTRIQRVSVKLYFMLFIITVGMIVVLAFSETVEKMILISLVALLIGFLVNAFLYQICFINDAGLGSVTSRFEMEIPWNEIQTYHWSENLLQITLKRKFFKHRKLKFNDPAATVAVNDRLRRLTDGRDERAS